MRIYGHPMSTCTRKVLMTLAERNTNADLQTVDIMSGAGKSPENMARQPFGRIPALEDGDFKVFESRAICRYVDSVLPGDALTPSDPKERALMEQWISVETSEFSPHAMTFIYKHVFQRPIDDAKMEAATKALDACSAVLDKGLAGKQFLCGDKLTLADIMYLPYLEYAMNTPAKDIFAKYPNVMAWWNRCSERPTWKKAAGKA